MSGRTRRLEPVGTVVGPKDLSRQPQPFQPPDPARVGVVHIGLAAVKHVVVVHELHIAGLKRHLNPVIGIVDQAEYAFIAAR